MIDATRQEVQAVVVVPGRELALQSQQVLESMRTGLRSMAVYGGRPTMEEHRKMREVRPQVVFGTPGRLNDHIDKGNLEAETVGVLVIDEYDKCLEMGFQAEMSRLVASLPAVRRKVLLSATRAEEVPAFMRNALKGAPEVVDFLPDDEVVSDRVLINKVRSEERDKLPALLQLLCQLGEGKTVVFLNYRDAVGRVADYLAEAGFDVSSLHGGLDQREREQAVYRFAERERQRAGEHRPSVPRTRYPRHQPYHPLSCPRPRKPISTVRAVRRAGTSRALPSSCWVPRRSCPLMSRPRSTTISLTAVSIPCPGPRWLPCI